MSHLYYINIQDVMDEKCIYQFRALLTMERLEKLDNFYFREDYLRSLLGEIVIRKKVGELAGIKPETICFLRSYYGKPFIKDLPDIHFNISHSGNWVVCLISKYACGIDIEKISGMHMDIAQRFLTKKEQRYLQEVEKRQQEDLFYELWTLKESYVKYKGKGLSIPLNSFEFARSGDNWKIQSPEQSELCFKQPDIAEGYKIAVCILDKNLDYERVKL